MRTCQWCGITVDVAATNPRVCGYAFNGGRYYDNDCCNCFKTRNPEAASNTKQYNKYACRQCQARGKEQPPLMTHNSAQIAQQQFAQHGFGPPATGSGFGAPSTGGGFGPPATGGGFGAPSLQAKPTSSFGASTGAAFGASTGAAFGATGAAFGASVQRCGDSAPKCPTAQHTMVFSCTNKKNSRIRNTNTKWECNRCSRSGTGYRWFCLQCNDVFCFQCEPRCGPGKPGAESGQAKPSAEMELSVSDLYRVSKSTKSLRQAGDRLAFAISRPWDGKDVQLSILINGEVVERMQYVPSGASDTRVAPSRSSAIERFFDSYSIHTEDAAKERTAKERAAVSSSTATTSAAVSSSTATTSKCVFGVAPGATVPSPGVEQQQSSNRGLDVKAMSVLCAHLALLDGTALSDSDSKTAAEFYLQVL